MTEQDFPHHDFSFSADANDAENLFSVDNVPLLLDVAEYSLAHGLKHSRPLAVAPAEFPPPLQQPGASFVTLRIGEALRGCIGSILARFPLVEDVARNAFAAGFRDPRFPPLSAAEFPHVSLSLSLLSEPEVVPVRSEEDLLNRMSEERRGWILTHGAQRGVLLPAVWDMIADPRDFLRALKQKAHLPADFWAPGIQIESFTSKSFDRRAEERRVRRLD